MPWNYQNNGSPWGTVDTNNDYKNRSSSQNKQSNYNQGTPPPDFDDLLRNIKDFFKKFKKLGILIFISIFLVSFWLLQCFYVSQQNEQAIELRFGKIKNNIIKDGLHFYLWPIDTYLKISKNEQRITLGNKRDEGLMLTGDHNIVYINFSVYYYVNDIASYLFNVNDQIGTLQQVAESAMREVVGMRPIEDVYRKKREEVSDEVLRIIQSTINKYSLGVNATRVAITEAAPPAEVSEAFDLVQKAEQERNREVESANQKKVYMEGSAKGKSLHILGEAISYKKRSIEKARGEARKFEDFLNAVNVDPERMRFYLYMETLDKILDSKNKIIIDKSISNMISYISLSEIFSKYQSPKEEKEEDIFEKDFPISSNQKG